MFKRAIFFLLLSSQLHAIWWQLDWRYPVGVSLTALYVAKNAASLPGIAQWNVISDLYETTSNLWTDKSDLQWQMGKQAAITLGGQLGASMLALRAQQHFVPIWQKHSEADLTPWKHASKCYLNYILIQFVFDCALDRFLTWGRSEISGQAEDALRAKYAKEESLLKLASLKQSDTRVHNVFGQFKESVDSALALQGSGISAIAKMAYYSKVLYDTQAMKMALWMLVVEQAGCILPAWIAGQVAQTAESLRGINAKIDRLQSDLMSQASAIVASNRAQELENTLKELVLERRVLEDSGRFWAGILPFVKKHMGSVEFVAKYAFVALWATLTAKQNPANVISGGFEFSRSVAWASDNAADLKKTEYNLHNVKEVLQLMDRPLTTSHFERHELEHPGIQLINAGIGMGSDEFIKDININLGPGRHVLVGKNGKGKSTLLKQIAGQRDHHAWSQGELSIYGSVIFVPQHEYWMPYQTLSGSLGANIQAEACREIGICRDDWAEVKRDWGKTLSGGECKKLALLAAVSKKPDILILDEIFDGMDPEAVEQSKKLIRSLGGEAVVIIVDHEYEAHNHDKFYAGILEINSERTIKSSSL